MKLCRFGEEGRERPGLILADGARVDASGFGADWDERFFGGGGLARLAAWERSAAASAPRVAPGERIAPAICRPSKIVCIGLNYRDHAQETAAKIPDEPIIFLKATSSFVGANDRLLLPPGSVKTDWEVELAVVIEKTARRVTEERALDHVAGFALHNDYSERAFQLERGGQWVKGKSCDTFAPFGPFLATRDEIPDCGHLRMWLKVNGQMRQDSSTANMIFDVPFLVSYVSQFMTLLPGDIISTGTPAGVGLGCKPPVYLRDGDVVELGIEGLGEARQEVVGAAAASAGRED
jgi:2-keto-4-pentenoate hydratase/2-oxohepta-3-ene-1,7-dioic acid hydratase in catechol pathway